MPPLNQANLKMKLTEAIVAALEPQGGERTRVWDTEITGLLLMIRPTGTKTFHLDYRTQAGRHRRIRLCGFLPNRGTLADARKRATQFLAAVDNGADPMEDRRRIRETATMSEFWAQFVADSAPRWKARTLTDAEYRWRTMLEPYFGRMPVGAVKTGDVAAWMRQQKHRPGTANIAFRLLRTVFYRAIDWEVIPGPNPCAKVRPFKSAPRERFLSADEVRLILQAVDELEEKGQGRETLVPDDPEALARIERELLAQGKPVKRKKDGTLDRRALKATERIGLTPWAAGLVRLLVWTGCRRDEIRTLRWHEVDFEGGVLRLEDSKTGAKAVPLSGPAVEELRRLEGFRSPGCPWVIQGKSPSGGPLIGAQRCWDRVRERANELLQRELAEQGLEPVPDPFKAVRLHDLRHSFASMAVAGGASLFLVGKALGHRNAATTNRYAHVSLDPMRQVAERVAELYGARPKAAQEVKE